MLGDYCLCALLPLATEKYVSPFPHHIRVALPDAVGSKNSDKFQHQPSPLTVFDNLQVDEEVGEEEEEEEEEVEGEQASKPAVRLGSRTQVSVKAEPQTTDPQSRQVEKVSGASAEASESVSPPLSRVSGRGRESKGSAAEASLSQSVAQAPSRSAQVRIL